MHNTSQNCAHGFALYFVLKKYFTNIIPGYFTGTEAIVYVCFIVHETTLENIGKQVLWTY